jgi:lysozyme family protein
MLMPLLQSTIYTMDPNAHDLIRTWNQCAEKEQKQQMLENKEINIAAAKYYMVTEQIVPFYLIGKLDNETFKAARLHNEQLLKRTAKK